jgi:hypothetical protein
MAVGEGFCRMAHRTVWCASHVTRPLGFDRRRSDEWDHRTVRWCTGQVLFTVRCAFWRCSALCARKRAFTVLCRRPLARSNRCSAGTPDSPVNYNGAAPQIPEAGKFELILPGAPDTAWWCTRHCPVAHRIVR